MYEQTDNPGNITDESKKDDLILYALQNNKINLHQAVNLYYIDDYNIFKEKLIKIVKENGTTIIIP